MDGWDEMPGFEDDHPLAAGVVPDDWCLKRSIQSALADGTYADVAHSGWIAELLERIPWYLCRGLQYPWIDQSTIYQAKSRAITQWISRVIYEDRRENFSGIYYTSKHGSDFDNWAIFEDKARLENLSKVSEILENDKDLLAACSLLHIKPPTLTLVSKTTA
jgi:hypothetical protein